MKNKYIIFIIIGIVIVGIIIFLCEILFKKKVEISEIKHMSFSYSQGYAMNAYIRYELDYKDDKYIAKIKPYGIPDEEASEVEVDKKTVKKIEEVLGKYEVGKWNGFHKTDKNVLDGDSFSMNVTFKDETSISASGYMRWPKNYGNVRDELDTIFMSLVDIEEK